MTWLLLLLFACPHQTRYPDGGGIEGQLDREVQALKGEIRILEYRLSTCHDDTRPDRTYNDLHQVFSGTEIEVSRSRGRTVVTIPGDHLYRTGRVDLRDEATMTLDLLATGLNLHPDHTITIETHTADVVPAGFDGPWDYSFAMANSLMTALVERFDVEPSRFALLARGEYAPLAPNDTEGGRRQNWRVRLILRGGTP